MATDRFQEIERRYEELNRELSLPEVASDPSRLRDLGKQHAELEEVVRTHRALDDAERQVAEWRDMAKDETDATLAGELRTELVAAERRAADLRAQLEALMIPKDPNDDKDVLRRDPRGPRRAGSHAVGRRPVRAVSPVRGAAALEGRGAVGLAERPRRLQGGRGRGQGEGRLPRLKHESGAHRVQRVPVTESSGRIHTSTATVAVLPEAEEVEVEIRPEDLQIDVYRSGGPGGQA